jgi:hypothetical protein
MYHLASISFWTHLTELLSDVVHVDLVLVHLKIVLVSVEDRCMVCVEHTTGLEIVLDAPDGTAR